VAVGAVESRHSPRRALPGPASQARYRAMRARREGQGRGGERGRGVRGPVGEARGRLWGAFRASGPRLGALSGTEAVRPGQWVASGR